MKTIKHLLTEEIRPKIRLSEIERLIRRHRIIIPPLSRKTLQKMCEDGTLETAGGSPGHIGWLVYEDSFLKWIESLDAEQIENAADGSRGVSDRKRRSFT